MNTYTLSSLPYPYHALQPYISEEIMRLHHEKHHASYISNLNIALEKHPELFQKNLEDILMNLHKVPDDIRTAVRNHGGGHLNHTLFWHIMKPHGGGEPMGELAQALQKTFGSFAGFQQQFYDEGLKRFGSGWVWLVQNNEGKLEVLSTPNQDTPLMENLKPIMGNDVWEHAYYLQYKNMRADYLKAWWNVVNWQEAERRFAKQ